MESKDTRLRTEQMRQHIESCKASGLTVIAYCKQNGLAPSNYYYWQKKLLSSSTNAVFVELQPNTIPDAVSVHYANGVRISFSANPGKLLQWDTDGFVLYEKGLERGSFERHSQKARWARRSATR